jgi:CubicO group peptidase (beta-lactamase class C family)
VSRIIIPGGLRFHIGLIMPQALSACPRRAADFTIFASSLPRLNHAEPATLQAGKMKSRLSLHRSSLLCALLALFARGAFGQQDIQGYLDSLAAENKLSGVIVVAKDGVPIARVAAGLANKTANKPIDLKTKFNLGSMNKMFTGVAIAQLAQAGRLRFDDSISKHLPDYPNKEIADKATIHHLLTHTSGMGMYLNDAFRAQREKLTTVAAHFPLFMNDPLAFPPGERFQYSNAAFIVLGAIIEKITGQDYYTYVRDHIYKPAGMLETGFYEQGKEIPNLAIGYTRMGPDGKPGNEVKETTERLEIKGGPAGGGYSTAGDLLKFQVALTGFKLLNREYTDLVTTGKVDAGGGIGRYAYGFGDKVVEGQRIVGHNGGWPGVAVNFDMFPDTGYTAIVLLNTDPPAMSPIITRLRQLIPASK